MSKSSISEFIRTFISKLKHFLHRHHVRRSKGWRFVGLGLVVVLMVSLVIWVGYLDTKITRHFTGKRWAVPAKVYARPLELFDGLQLSEAQLGFELELLNYTQVAGPPGPGQFQLNQGSYQISTRGFDFWEGSEASQRVTFTLRNEAIQQLASDGGSDDIVRLEPALIGGIYPAHNEDRVLVKLDQVPAQLTATLLAVEDRNFYQHHGLSFKGIARALVTNVSSGSVVQGGSTLTQQLVKNFYLNSERSLSRKVVEAVMSLLLDFHYEKDDILEAYLNEVYLGQAGRRGIHGVGLASLFYFGQPLRELKTHQIALLVGIVKGPSWYDPRRQPERSLERRNQVLEVMVEQGVIEQEAYDQARQQPLDVIGKPLYEDARYPAFLDLVKRQLQKDYRDEDLRSEGLRIFTTLDPWVQENFENVVQSQANRLSMGYQGQLKNVEAAGLITASNSGEVLGIIGGRDVRYQGFNRALDAYRPIGSLVKPAVYLAALEQGYTLAQLIPDEPVELVLPNGDTWSPENYDKETHGEVPLLIALAKSYNLATVHLAMTIGIDRVVDVMTRLGVTKKLPEVPALALGAVSLSPFEVTQMYQTIASEGFNSPLRTIRSVLTAAGEPLQRYPLDVEQRFDSSDIYLLTRALQETVKSGTAHSVQQVLDDDLKLAGKTGTSDEQRDSWFAGFSGNYLSVVWMGVDDNRSMPITGASGALQIWAQTFASLHQVPLDLTQPADVQWAWIEPLTQNRKAKACEGTVYIPMRSDTLPDKITECESSGTGVIKWFKGWFN